MASWWTPLCDYNRVQDGGEVLRQSWFWGALRQLQGIHGVGRRERAGLVGKVTTLCPFEIKEKIIWF